MEWHNEAKAREEKLIEALQEAMTPAPRPEAVAFIRQWRESAPAETGTTDMENCNMPEANSMADV